MPKSCLLFALAIALPIALLFSFRLAQAQEPIQIVTTTGMITDIAHNVAGDAARVMGLIGSGIDPHLYKPTRSDIAKLTSADVIFYNGLFLEGKMADAFIRIARSGKPVFAVTELLDTNYLLEPEEFQGAYDPHVWMDPLAWKQAVELIRDKLSELYPDKRSDFAQNAKRYLAKLDALHDYARTALESVPKASRVLVTAHDAFNYFGRRYNLEVLGIQGLSTESEAGVRDIERLVDILVERKVPAVFIESTVSDRNVLALLEGAKARGQHVEIGGTLFSDAMGVPGTYTGTYIGMIDHNVTRIVSALGGVVPERGMQDKL